MNVYFKAPSGLSRAMTRVENALRKHLPAGVREVTDRSHADLEVLHVIGHDGISETLDSMTAKQYAVIQYCVKTTEWSPAEWLGALWSNFPKKCTCVWSYYDLNAMLRDDYKELVEDGRLVEAPQLHNFYHAPLGVDQNFRRWNDKERYIAACTGYVAKDECLHEIFKAAHGIPWPTTQNVFHLGPGTEHDDSPAHGFLNVRSMLDINDDVLAQMYSRARYVCGLRRVEGFEMPLAEGLLCGATPVTFDAPHYRKWYDGIAYFIKEGTPKEVEDQLRGLFSLERSNNISEWANEARNRFNWHTIAPGFWQRALSSSAASAPSPCPPPQITVGEPRKKVLWVGDAVVSSGFGIATHHICDELHKCHDVRVLGLHYDGDPHPYPYKIHTTWWLQGGDVGGTKKLPMIIDGWKPDVVVIQNDPWNFVTYTQPLQELWAEKPEAHRPVMVGAVAVDGLNCRGRGMRHLDHAVFWTHFGQREAERGGWEGPSDVIPLGVDLETFHAEPRLVARRFLGFPPHMEDAFIVGYVGRNHTRKRLDLLVRYFAKWIQHTENDDAVLFIHHGPTGDDSWDIPQLIDYYKVSGRVVSSRPPLGFGANDKEMRMTFSAMDAFASCTQGEGWGLPHLEAAACRVPNIFPHWSALGEIFDETGYPVLCSSVYHTPKANAVGGVVDEGRFISALDLAYNNKTLREEMAAASLKLASQPQFRWSNIGKAWVDVVNKVVHRSVPEAVSA